MILNPSKIVGSEFLWRTMRTCMLAFWLLVAVLQVFVLLELLAGDEYATSRGTVFGNALFALIAFAISLVGVLEFSRITRRNLDLRSLFMLTGCLALLCSVALPMEIFWDRTFGAFAIMIVLAFASHVALLLQAWKRRFSA